MYFSFPNLTKLSRFFRCQTISCKSLLNFARKMREEVLDHFGFFSNYDTQSNWSSNRVFIAAFMLHTGFLNNFILSLKISHYLQFHLLKSSINLCDLSLSHCTLKNNCTVFLLETSSPTDSSWLRSFASLREKFRNSLFFYELKTSCCSNHLLSLIF